MSNPELQTKYNSYKQTLTQISSKVSELESEADEHTIVIKTLKGVPKDRKCFRMIGGVLVEKTAGDVIPTLETNVNGIKKILEQLLKEYKKTETEFVNWQKEKNIKVVSTY